jgi:S1-C subfamily serine protease
MRHLKATPIISATIGGAAATLHPLRLACSPSIQVGDPAYAIGNPFGLNAGV